MKLKRLREAKGMSQDALAKKAKLTREHVNRLEAGRHDPTVGVIQRLSKALGVPVTELLG
ncbi:MAG TPA: helix-turn-helix transcriptional regulator [Candidatus Limnocylindrales bacterium]|nr:helix-turn-helix transcriptional regulator [Candidatus Limnocylindrales bacterium]